MSELKKKIVGPLQRKIENTPLNRIKLNNCYHRN